MKHRVDPDVTGVDGHLQGVGDHCGAHVRSGLPADHHPGGQIDDGSQVQPAFTGPQIGDVPDQPLTGSRSGEVPID
jgi:hypothetical protein